MSAPVLCWECASDCYFLMLSWYRLSISTVSYNRAYLCYSVCAYYPWCVLPLVHIYLGIYQISINSALIQIDISHIYQRGSILSPIYIVKSGNLR